MKDTETVCRDAAIKKIFLYPLRERFICFLIIGILSTLVDAGFLFVLTEYYGIWYLWSATASYCCGILVSYTLNRYYTFYDRSRHYLAQFSLFTMISVSSLAINLIIIFIAVDFFAVHYLVGKGLAVGISFLLNYIGQSRITFHT